MSKEHNKYLVSTRRMWIKRALVSFKGGCCQVCGFKGHDSCFDLHHIEPGNKDLQLGSGNTPSYKKVAIEASKCVLLCGNCHKEAHYKAGFVCPEPSEVSEPELKGLVLSLMFVSSRATDYSEYRKILRKDAKRG